MIRDLCAVIAVVLLALAIVAYVRRHPNVLDVNNPNPATTTTTDLVHG
jgi:hypothetical protein